MNTHSYIVTYDLVGTSESSADYERLIERIQTYQWANLQYSAWIVRSSQSVAQIPTTSWSRWTATIGDSSPG